MIERPAVVRQILQHLGLPTGAASLRAPPDQTQGLAGDPPREWSSDPVVDLPVRGPTCLPSPGDRQAQTGDLPGPDPAIA